MSDDLHLRYRDRFFLSLKEDYEVRDFEKAIREKRPNTSTSEIHTALHQCASEFSSNHPRQKIFDCVLSRLNGR